MAPLLFASADRTTLLQDGASELFDSEFADLPVGARMYAHGGDRGPMPQAMDSRKGMQGVLKHLDLELADALGLPQTPPGMPKEEL